MLPALFFFIKISLDSRSHGSIQILALFSYFCEKYLWNFDRDCVKPMDDLGSVDFNNIKPSHT